MGFGVVGLGVWMGVWEFGSLGCGVLDGSLGEVRAGVGVGVWESRFGFEPELWA